MRRGVNGGILSMKKILLVGNSHVGAFKSGLLRLQHQSSLGHIKFDFLACRQPLDPRGGFNLIRLEKQSIITAPAEVIASAMQTSTIKMPVNIDVYDLVLILAGPCLLHPFLFYSEKPVAIPSLSNSLIRSILLCSKDIPVSTREINSPALVKMLRELTGNRIVYVGAPLPSVDSNLLAHFKQLDEKNMTKMKKNSLSISCILRSDLFAHQNIFIPDGELLNEYCFATNARFMRQGVRVDGVSTNPDMRHANEEYGCIVLSKILRSFGFMS